MHLLDPQILKDASGVSPLISGASLAVGLFLWLWGGRSHRFWLALVITVAAGLFGLSFGPASGMQPLVAGLLLAVAAGALALSLVRILLFVGGGLLGMELWHLVAPDLGQPLVAFVVGGLVGVFLYRFWITALASLTGTLLIGYSGLCLAERLGKLNSVAFVERNGPLLNWGCASWAVLGILVQFLLERRRRRKQGERARARKVAEERARAVPSHLFFPPPKPPPVPWWKRLPGAIRKRAG